jgi:peptide/nickel transport system permease protein
MTDLSLTVDLQAAADEKRKATIESISRLTKYSAYKLAMLIITVVIGIYLTILIANMGGYVDKIRRGQIRENVSLAASSNPKMREMPYEERAKLIEDQVRIQEDRLGLNKPFIVRSFGFLAECIDAQPGAGGKPHV